MTLQPTEAPSQGEGNTRIRTETQIVPPYALQSELYLLPVMDHFGNIYSVSTISLDGRQTDDGVTEAVEVIHRPVSVTLSKEEPRTDPSFLENALKKPLNKNKEKAGRKEALKENQTLKNEFRNSELPGSLEDSNNDYFSTKKSQFLWKNEDDGVNNIRRHDSQIGKKEYITLPDLKDFPSLPCQGSDVPADFPGITEISSLEIHRNEASFSFQTLMSMGYILGRKVIKQIKQVKEERRYLQRIKEELIKVEKQYEQSILRQYRACDSSKKKYFETKKVTASLEEVLVKCQEDLELYYKKLLLQLKAREIKIRLKTIANITNSKNNLILHITEVQCAIDQLKRKSDIQKIKLIIQAKMRKQAISDVSTLKAALTQKNINTSLQLQLGSIGCCHTF
ncbi:spermatogenesis associated 1 [Phyllostomus discolor]|uniref:Spermatogenesis associated 1 n=1 Tax=Phyllostomus discolor TaxID=89673 RepID=A0A834AKQ6_9CHIR|nr:spermatogenesis associated 1 [Phyllostomus discolor]